MAAVTVAFDELPSLIGRDLGRTAFRPVTQTQIDAFGDVTDDHQWVHERSERAEAGPFGGPIAQGFLTLALLTPLSEELIEVTDAASRINYGLDRVRFTSIVPAGARIALHAVVDDVIAGQGWMRVALGCEIEREQAARPAVVARFIIRFAGPG